MWACHGPAGGALPFGYRRSRALRGGSSTSPTRLWRLRAGATSGRGFIHPARSGAVSPRCRFAPPAAVAESACGSAAAYRPGVLGTHVDDRARVARRAGSLDGVFASTAGGAVGRAGHPLRADPATHCDATGTGVDFRFAALMVRDESKPTFTVGGSRATPPA